MHFANAIMLCCFVVESGESTLPVLGLELPQAASSGAAARRAMTAVRGIRE
jgi:hypothetical protein